MHSRYLSFVTIWALTACSAHPVILPQEEAGYSQTMLAQINLYRKDNGLNSLRPDPILTYLAKTHSAEMYEKKKASHRHFDDRLAQAQSSLCVENVGWNYGSPESMFGGWQQSSGHNRNLLNKEICRVGIAEIGQYVTFFACK
jgi:uncharacterized protein YkwD